MVACAGEPEPGSVALGEPVAIGSDTLEIIRAEPAPNPPPPINVFRTLTVRSLENLALTEGEQGIAVYLDLRVEDHRAPEQEHGRGFQSLVSDPYLTVPLGE